MRMTSPCGRGGAGAAGFGGAAGRSFVGPETWTSTAGLRGWLEAETGTPSFIAKSGQYLATRNITGSPSPRRFDQRPPASFTGNVLLAPEGPVTVASYSSGLPATAASVTAYPLRASLSVSITGVRGLFANASCVS